MDFPSRPRPHIFSNMQVPPDLKVLTCNSHEAYVWSLSKLDINLHIIDELPGRYTRGWDTHMRPIPDNSRILDLGTALHQIESYDCFIAHNIDDLLLVKDHPMPKILLFHDSLKGYQVQESNQIPQEDVQRVVRTYLEKIKALPVSISKMKQESWGVWGPIVAHYIDSDFFCGYTGDNPRGLRVVNQFTAKSQILKMDFHEALTEGRDIQILGFNPDLSGSRTSNDLQDLRDHYRSHRYYIHTAEPDLEDGYNLASLEAMSVGMPIVCNLHPSSPVIDGVHGCVGDEPDNLREKLKLLEDDREYASSLGAAGRQYILDNHGLELFKANWVSAIKASINQF